MWKDILVVLLVLGVVLVPAAAGASYQATADSTLLITLIDPLVEGFSIELRSDNNPSLDKSSTGNATANAAAQQLNNATDPDHLVAGEGFTAVSASVDGVALHPAVSVAKSTSLVAPQLVAFNRSGQPVNVEVEVDYNLTAFSQAGAGESASAWASIVFDTSSTSGRVVDEFVSGNGQKSGTVLYSVEVSPGQPKVEIFVMYLYASGSAAVPEPGTLSLVLAGGLLLLPALWRRTHPRK